MASTPALSPAIFKPGTLDALLKERGVRANRTATRMLAEYLRVFTAEAVHRAGEAAKKSSPSSSTVEVEHIKAVLAELLLDF